MSGTSAKRKSPGRHQPRLDVFAALADATRRDLLDLLREGDRTVNELAGRFEITRPAISQHLRVLRDHGLVAEERVGRHRYYSLRAKALRQVGEWIASYEAFWDARLDRLRSELDKQAKR